MESRQKQDRLFRFFTFDEDDCAERLETYNIHHHTAITDCLGDGLRRDNQEGQQDHVALSLGVCHQITQRNKLKQVRVPNLIDLLDPTKNNQIDLHAMKEELKNFIEEEKDKRSLIVKRSAEVRIAAIKIKKLRALISLLPKIKNLSHINPDTLNSLLSKLKIKACQIALNTEDDVARRDHLDFQRSLVAQFIKYNQSVNQLTASITNVAKKGVR